jgi:hypothetical protein
MGEILVVERVVYRVEFLQRAKGRQALSPAHEGENGRETMPVMEVTVDRGQWMLRQAARKEIGLVVGPSYVWSLITDIHGRMARVRAIESGFTLLRPTYNGRTLAVDPWGRTRASVDHPADAVVAHVPVLHLGTVFGSLGNWLGWASLVVGVAVLTAIAARRTEKKENHGR